MTAPRLLTLDDVADRIGVSRTTVKRLVAAGELRVVDISATAGGRRRVRIREDELTRWINKRTAETKSA